MLREVRVCGQIDGSSAEWCDLFLSVMFGIAEMMAKVLISTSAECRMQPVSLVTVLHMRSTMLAGLVSAVGSWARSVGWMSELGFLILGGRKD